MSFFLEKTNPTLYGGGLSTTGIIIIIAVIIIIIIIIVVVVVVTSDSTTPTPSSPSTSKTIYNPNYVAPSATVVPSSEVCNIQYTSDETPVLCPPNYYLNDKNQCKYWCNSDEFCNKAKDGNPEDLCYWDTVRCMPDNYYFPDGTKWLNTNIGFPAKTEEEVTTEGNTMIYYQNIVTNPMPYDESLCK